MKSIAKSSTLTPRCGRSKIGRSSRMALSACASPLPRGPFWVESFLCLFSIISLVISLIGLVSQSEKQRRIDPSYALSVDSLSLHDVLYSSNTSSSVIVRARLSALTLFQLGHRLSKLGFLYETIPLLLFVCVLVKLDS